MPLPYIKLRTLEDLMNNTFHPENSAVCHVAIQNYSPNYNYEQMSIITIIIY